MQPPQITNERIAQACAAALEVLSGAGSARILALVDQLTVAKLVLRSVAAGETIIGTPAPEASAAEAK